MESIQTPVKIEQEPIVANQTPVPKNKLKLILITTVILAVVVGYFFYKNYERSSAEKAVILYACESDVIQKTTAIISSVQSGVTKENFGAQTMEDLMAKGMRMAQMAQPVAAEIKTHPEIMKYRSYFKTVLKKEKTQKNNFYLAIVRKIMESCPAKATNSAMTSEAVALIIASAAN